jgi:hypothetical protein
MILFVFTLAACTDRAAPGSQPDLQSSTQLASNDWQPVPLPDISHQPIRLRVAYAENARLKPISAELLAQILPRTEAMVSADFAIDVELELTAQLSIEALFSRLDPAIVRKRQKEIVNIDHVTRAVYEDMQLAVYKTLQNYADDKAGVIAYAQPYLSQPEQEHDDFISFSYALVDTLLQRLDYWRKQPALDGRPVISDDPYHQWVWWDSLGYSALPYDIIITNQLVASAEYYGMDVHSSIRGGITAGTTTYNKESKMHSYVFVMLYPMLNDSGLLTRLRQDEHYDADQVVNYSAALLTHELGHMLLHLGHPFANRHCVMSPTVMLNYRDWYESIDPGQCAVGSNEEMQPGAAKLIYNVNW